MKLCFQIHPNDNVATLLDDAATELIEVIRAGGDTALNPNRDQLTLNQPVLLGHKTALCDIHPNTPIIKFGIQIGTATQYIRSGDWVHLHNCASFVDARSASLDLQTGRPADTPYI
jgi:altronate dehydratase small subunit